MSKSKDWWLGAKMMLTAITFGPFAGPFLLPLLADQIDIAKD